jgi:hypothetical protein
VKDFKIDFILTTRRLFTNETEFKDYCVSMKEQGVLVPEFWNEILGKDNARIETIEPANGSVVVTVGDMVRK